MSPNYACIVAESCPSWLWSLRHHARFIPSNAQLFYVKLDSKTSCYKLLTTYHLIPCTFPRPRFFRISGEFFLVYSNQLVFIDADFYLFVTVVTKSRSTSKDSFLVYFKDFVCDLYLNLLQGVSLCCTVSHRSPRRVFTRVKTNLVSRTAGNEVEWKPRQALRCSTVHLFLSILPVVNIVISMNKYKTNWPLL